MRQNNQLDAPSVLGYWHGGAGGHAVWEATVGSGAILSQIKWPEMDSTAGKKCVSVVSALIAKSVRHCIDISRERQDDQRPVKNMDHDNFIIYVFIYFYTRHYRISY